MIQEFLVVLACLSDKGCSPTSTAYYHARPEVKEMIELQERRIKQWVGPQIVERAAPFVFIAAGGTGNFKLYKNLSLEIKNFNEPKLVYSLGF